MEELHQELKQLIVDTLNLEDISPDEIVTEDPLFIDGLGLDSIDALELGLAIKQRYNIQISPETDAMKEHFYSVRTLADYITASRERA